MMSTLFTKTALAYNDFMEILGVTAAAAELGVKPNRVRELIRLGKLPAQQLGREWAITRADLDKFKARIRPVGRPKKITVRVDPITAATLATPRPAVDEPGERELPY